MSYQNYKTQMCKNMQATGKCYYGVKCQFAHSEGELRKKPCHFYETYGRCKFGDNCRFVHIRKDTSIRKNTFVPRPQGLSSSQAPRSQAPSRPQGLSRPQAPRPQGLSRTQKVMGAKTSNYYRTLSDDEEKSVQAPLTPRSPKKEDFPALSPPHSPKKEPMRWMSVAKNLVGTNPKQFEPEPQKKDVEVCVPIFLPPKPVEPEWWSSEDEPEGSLEERSEGCNSGPEEELRDEFDNRSRVLSFDCAKRLSWADEMEMCEPTAVY